MEYGHFKRRDQGGFRDRNDNRSNDRPDNRGNDRNDNRGGFRDRNDNRSNDRPDNRGNDRDRGGFDRDRGGDRGGFRGGFDRNRGGGGGYERGGGGGGFDRDNEESVFSKRVRAGKRRTYFFDVKKTKGEDYFITITESTRREDGYGYKRHKIFLYKEDFNRFVASLNEVVNHVKTDLMPDFDYEEFDRRQAEWEAQNRDMDDEERGGAFRPRGEFRDNRVAREDEPIRDKGDLDDDFRDKEDLDEDIEDKEDLEDDIRDERDDLPEEEEDDKKRGPKDDDDVNW